MEKGKKKHDEKKNGAPNNGIVKEIEVKWPENVTQLDLSSKNLTFEENVTFPPNLTHLSLSGNNLKEVPSAALHLEKLKWLDLSNNQIKLFDDTPNFCHSIEELNLSRNALNGPPYWVWVESPEKLTKINLSNNINITNELKDGYIEELLQYKTLVKEVILYNCRIRNLFELFGTFPAAKILELGTPDFSTFLNNNIDHVPCKGLDKCCDIQTLNLSNMQIHSIEPTIDMYKHLVEINLSYNKICSIPSKFCELENLETCTLSFNSILYLPEDMVKLKKLYCLRLDSNELCMVPENLCTLPKLKILDLYDNSLYDMPIEIMNVEELDLAQNYMEEPVSEEYKEKKGRIRLNVPDRRDGRKPEQNVCDDEEYSPDASDDEEFLNYMNNPTQAEPPDNGPPSSPEDWDSEDYWEPHYAKHMGRITGLNTWAHTQNYWLNFVQSKMREGNFCPMDLHTVPVCEQVKYEKQCNPKTWTIVEGQFDDYSDEGS